MDTITRDLARHITEALQPNKAVLLFGARRVGKTVLMKQIIQQFSGKVLLLNGEDYDAQQLLATPSISNYKQMLAGIHLLAIDEAQNIPQIGAKLKLIVDEIEGIRVIATGSSSFDLSNKAGEPLVGRSNSFYLSPFSQHELGKTQNILQTKQELQNRLIYGSYPDVVKLDTNSNRVQYLSELVNAYLLKDILSFDGIKNASKMRDLLRCISLQVGSEVSYDELAKTIGLSKNTVEKYLDLLSKVFVIFRVGGYANNLRKEISKAGKWYFYDNGIRNALINNFSPLATRQDTGILWENYIISERLKNKHNNLQNKDFYFWRTYDQQEIDFLEVQDNQIAAFEIKHNSKTPSCPKIFEQAYPNATYKVINIDNYLEFIG
ncbi:MAG: ATP-binding protein [Paludibacteraceae bacterium]|nr:ATP-binding protein [Paludibacteraceae bacterium]